MELFFEAYLYYLENQGFFWEAMGRHLALSLSALAISVLIGVPLGVWISRRARAAELAISGKAAPLAWCWRGVALYTALLTHARMAVFPS